MAPRIELVESLTKHVETGVKHRGWLLPYPSVYGLAPIFMDYAVFDGPRRWVWVLFENVANPGDSPLADHKPDHRGNDGRADRSDQPVRRPGTVF
jgi:hypothetical protein